MPPPAPLRQHIVTIDKEWASTLVGLPVLVPNCWWKGYRRDNDTLNGGTIVGVVFNQPNSTCFQLECAGKIYLMRYDAVYLFADLDHASYEAIKFRLPMVAPANPANKEGVTAPQKKNKNICVEGG
jgi:hypothetical protein